MLLVGSTSLAAEFVLNLGHGATVDNPRNIVAQEYADWVYKQTDGKVKINIQPAESIGSDREMMESIIMGTLDMSVNSQGAMAIFDKRIGVFGLPFLFKNMEEIEIILGGPFGEKFAEMVNKDNKFEILGFFDNGVVTKPGDIELTVIPKGLTSLAKTLVKDSIPALEAQ